MLAETAYPPTAPLYLQNWNHVRNKNKKGEAETAYPHTDRAADRVA
jgi:hypothetical protein